MQLRVAACQILTYPDPAQSADKVLHWMEQDAADGVDVVLFPEACLCGYQCDGAYWEAARPEVFAAAEARIIAAAAALELATIVGTVHWEEGGVRNSLLVIDKGGIVRGRYAKTHLAESWSRPGRALPIYRVAGVPSCFLVCHDIRYPELVRLPAIAGAQVCYFASNESGLTEEYKLSAYRAMPIARAAENGIYLVMANAPANAADITSHSQSHGNSKIVHPDGNVLDEARFFEERLVTATIDTDAATRWVAQRALSDDTILAAWLRDGLRLVRDASGGEG